MALTDAQLRVIRNEVGSAPDDDTLDDMFTALGNTTAVALDVLRPRLADLLATQPVSIPGVISVGAPAGATQLAQQISRLEAALAVQTGDADSLAAYSVVAGRVDRVR